MNEAGFGREHIAENHDGHFGLLILNIRRSECTIYDSMNHQFDNSPYFLSTKIKNAVTGLHDFYRRGQGKEKRQLAFSQAVVPGQGLNDCGVHLLANAELAAQGHEPAVQQFSIETMAQIRRYHFLLRERQINVFRIKYIN